jgi:hypothetical protein
MKSAYGRWRTTCGTVLAARTSVRFIAIDFEPVVGEILEKVEDGQMGVVLKRMMVRAASSQIAERYGVQALVTGEALGQVSSQTLTNLRLIDNVIRHADPASADLPRQRAHHQEWRVRSAPKTSPRPCRNTAA